MIYGVVGRPGGGKSYCSVEIILKALEQGRTVVTNIPMISEHEKLLLWDWDYLVKKDGKTLPDYPLGSLYVLDECWRAFMNGTRLDQLGEHFLSFFKESRHRVSEAGFSDDIVLVTQDMADIANCIRSLVDQTILCGGR